MFAWAGWVDSYEMVSGYNSNSGGWRSWFIIHPVQDQPDPDLGEVTINVHFGDHEIGPGASFGGPRPNPSGTDIDVKLPWDGFPTFWRAIEQKCFLSFFGQGDAITSYGTHIWEGPEGVTDQDRRERIDSMRRRFEEANESY